MVRHKILILLCAGNMLLLGGCASNAREQVLDRSAGTDSGSVAVPAGPDIETTVYIGEYLDADVGEPNLEIAKGDDGKFIVQIGIYRLTSLSDGIGELTDDGMRFTATDASGNPIRGVITVEDQTASVTFTDSTWDNLPNGSTFQYTKASDIPNIWIE